MKREFDILIFGGQSNMQGHTEALPEPNDPVEGALEYHFLTDDLVPLCHPVGENIGEDSQNLLLAMASFGHGSLAPACCRAYTEMTGREVIAIHAARGATAIAEWQKGTPRYEAVVKKLLAGIEKAREVGTIGKIYYLWLQGETDSVYETRQSVYEERLTAYKNALKEDIGIDRFCIIEVGYFTALWPDRGRKEDYELDEEIMRAQEHIVTVDPDFVMLTQICKTLSLDSKYLVTFVPGHYNNLGIDLIGTEAGKALSQL